MKRMTAWIYYLVLVMMPILAYFNLQKPSLSDSVVAQTLSPCGWGDSDKTSIPSSDVVHWSTSDGRLIEKLCIGMETGSSAPEIPMTSNGSNECFSLMGLATTSITLTRTNLQDQCAFRSVDIYKFPSPSLTPTQTPTPSGMPTLTPTPSVSMTPMPTQTPQPTGQPTLTPVPTQPPAVTPTPKPEENNKSMNLSKSGPNCEERTFSISVQLKDDGKEAKNVGVSFTYLNQTKSMTTNNQGRGGVDLDYAGKGEVRAEAEGWPTARVTVDELTCDEAEMGQADGGDQGGVSGQSQEENGKILGYANTGVNTEAMILLIQSVGLLMIVGGSVVVVKA